MFRRFLYKRIYIVYNKHKMFLPDEMLNLILSFREIHPVSLLIRESINEYELLRKKTHIHNQFESYYLSTLFGYNQFINNKKWSMEHKKYEPQLNKLKEKNELFYIDGINRHNDEDKMLYLQHIEDTEEFNCYNSFRNDIQHSLECCGMINEEYFHRLVINDRYVKWYDKWYNKYRNEMYNENRIIKKRPVDIHIDGYDGYFLKTANDYLNMGLNVVM